MKVGILISGRGSNMESLIHRLGSTVALVISNKPDAAGLERAVNLNIPTAVVNHCDFHTREDFDAALVGKLQGAGVEMVCLAGFMRLLTKKFLSHFPTVNIHPSLLPRFKGNWRIHERVLKSGDVESGCTVHQVTETMDDERFILGQRRVPVMADDTPQKLATRVLQAEHELYPDIVKKILGGEITLRSPQA